MKTLCRDPACGLDWGGIQIQRLAEVEKEAGTCGQCEVAELGFGVVGGG
jgi:hypothetical protein